MNNNNYCVIMAGGIGSRFWPASRTNRPKQFLDFFGTGKSLFQLTIDRFRPLVPIENIVIVTNVIYRETIFEQIPDLKPQQVLCEPARRNTAPCIAYAITYIRGIRKQAGLDDNANIVVAASDHMILMENKFQEVIAKAFQYTATHNDLLTLGMKPTRPETGYGYIQMKKDSEEDGVYVVKTFTEKPNLEIAKTFVQSGEFLWNSGIFIWNLQTIIQALKQNLPDMMEKFEAGLDIMGTAKEEDFIQEMFPTCPNISIDYSIMEKAHNVRVIAADFGWSDLGTWGSLYELSHKDEEGNAALKCEAIFYESNNNIVTLPSGKLAVIQGMQDMIVAESDDVLLICQKEKEQSIRKWVNDVDVKFEGKYN